MYRYNKIPINCDTGTKFANQFNLGNLFEKRKNKFLICVSMFYIFLKICNLFILFYFLLIVIQDLIGKIQ